MKLIYSRTPNKIVSTFLKPFGSVLPKKLWFPVYGNYTIKLDDTHSIRMNCNPTSFLGRLLFWGGVQAFEFKTVRIFRELIKKSDTFLDIGSNIGYYSLVAASYNPQIRIWAFEPLPAAVKYLRKNIASNGYNNITVVQKALSETKGNIRFYSVRNPKFDKIEDHLSGDGTINPDNAGVGEQFEVETISLDNFVTEAGIQRVDFIKIDTEASEHLVFQSGMNVLKTHRPIIQCEIIPGLIEEKLEAIFRDLNYLYYKTHDDGLELVHSLVNTLGSSTDYYFVPVEKQEDVQRFLKVDKK
jgi:FkbM family methyltransferase